MNKMTGYLVDAVDIDNEEDWQLAELKYKLKKGFT
jgi:CMP-N-acetylneuraminic acid synthetase